MGVLGSCAVTWNRYCRRLKPEEAGGLWALVGMASGARINGVVRARLEVIALAMNADDDKCLEIMQGLQQNGLIRLDRFEGRCTVFVWPFNDSAEKSRRAHRERTRRWRAAAARKGRET